MLVPGYAIYRPSLTSTPSEGEGLEYMIAKHPIFPREPKLEWRVLRGEGNPNPTHGATRRRQVSEAILLDLLRTC